MRAVNIGVGHGRNLAVAQSAKVGLRPLLEDWGRKHGLRPEWIQPEKRRKVAHYDVFGPAAEALIAHFKAD